jgi:Zn-dependent protease
MLLNYFSNMTVLVIASIVMILALVFHNVFQTWVASRLGDHSPRLAGFGAFDPQRQLDGFGVILLLILGFGWPRQIPVNSRNYRRKREALVWYSGPLAYLIVALLSFIIALLLERGGGIEVATAFLVAGRVAILHAAINLFPVLPLDGGHGALVLGNASVRRLVHQIAGYGTIGFIVLFLLLSMSGLLNRLVTLLQRFLVGIIQLIPGL